MAGREKACGRLTAGLCSREQPSAALESAGRRNLLRTIPEVVGPVVILPNFELRPIDAVVSYWDFVVILPNSSPLQQNRCRWKIDGIERGPDTPDPILLNASFGGEGQVTGL